MRILLSNSMKFNADTSIDLSSVFKMTHDIRMKKQVILQHVINAINKNDRIYQ